MAKTKHTLERLFSPASVAVIGASRTPGKIGHDIVKNATQFGYKGKVHPVNPKADEILGLNCYSSVMDIPGKVDVAVIVIPSKFVAHALEECGQKGIPYAVVISAGFKETGEAGLALEESVRAVAQEHGIRLVGPNCLGFMNAHTRLNASFASGMPKKGNIAMLSQSGAMGVALLDWAYQQRLGFSKVITVGNKLDIDEVDCLEYFAADAKTDVIMMYLESITDGVAFVEAASKIASKKPIIVLKAGASEQAKKAVSSHTGSLAGSEEAINTAFEKAGIIRAHTIEEFFDLGMGFSMQPLPAGPRVAIVTNAGGPGIMAVDAAPGTGVELPQLTKTLQKKLAKYLPAAASTKNPIDVIGDATHERYEDTLHTVLPSKEIDAAVVILTPQVMTDEDETAKMVADLQRQYGKPVLTSFMGGRDIHSADMILDVRGIPNYATPERAIRTIGTMAQHGGQTIKPVRVAGSRTKSKTKQLPESEGFHQIRTIEAEQILAEYNIPVLQSRFLATKSECDSLTEKDFPCVMKVASRDVVHKAASGAIQLNIQNKTEAKKAWETITAAVRKKMGTSTEIEGMLVQPMVEFTKHTREVIIGMKRDPSFGPLLLFGLGGSLVEIFHDVSFGLAPLTLTEAKQMINSIQTAPLLAKNDTNVIARTLVAVSKLALDYPEITELDINPFIVQRKAPGRPKKGEMRGVAVDVRMMTV